MVNLLIFTLACSIASASLAQDSPTIVFGGRVLFDGSHIDNDKFDYAQGGELRRAQLFVDGSFARSWRYHAEADFAPADPVYKDNYLRYSGSTNSRITIGQFKQFSSLEQLTSSNHTTFMERSLPDALVTGRRLGVGYQYWNDSVSTAVSAYGNDLNNKSQGSGLAGRFVYRPVVGDGSLLHLGFNSAREEFAETTSSLCSAPEIHKDSHCIVDTGVVPDSQGSYKTGLEAAYVNGRLSAQAEYIQQRLQRRSVSDLSFNGYYAYASLFLTKDQRPYIFTSGVFGRVLPTSSGGAWEIAARASNLDLSDRDINGGEVDTFTLGLNYYRNSDWLFMFNFIHANADFAANDDDPRILQMRIRLTF